MNKQLKKITLTLVGFMLLLLSYGCSEELYVNCHTCANVNSKLIPTNL